jgi:hypothetical protein
MLAEQKTQLKPSSSDSLPYKAANWLRHQKDFVGIGIFHFRSRRKSFHIDVLTGRIGAFHQVRFARNWNSIGIISLCNLRRRSRGWRRCCHFFPRRGLGGSVGIEWLLRRRISLGRGWRIPCGAMLSALRWRFFGARRNEEYSDEGRQH